MGNLMKRYYHNIRRRRKAYLITFAAVAAAVIVGLLVFSALNASFNKTLRLDDPEVNPQDYSYVSRMFFAGHATYSEARGEDGKPLVSGYQFQTREQAAPMHKLMNVYFSEVAVRRRLLKEAKREDLKFNAIHVQISEYGSMCYRFHVFSQELKLTKAVASVMEDKLAEMLEQDLGITYVRVVGQRSTKTDQPMPPHYLFRINDSRSKAIAEEEMNERPESLERIVFGPAFCAAAGLGMGFLVVLFLLILSEYFSNALYKPEQIQALTDRPFLAGIPYRAPKNAFRVLAKTIISSGAFGKTLLVAGCDRKSRVHGAASGLARGLAEEGKKVLLLNLSSAVRGLDDQLKLEKKNGISDVVSGRIEIQSPEENLAAVPAGSNLLKLEEACESEAFEAFILKAKEEYDYILMYDTNITESPQVYGVMQYTDGVLLAVEYDVVSPSQLRMTLERLDMMGQENQSVVMVHALS